MVCLFIAKAEQSNSKWGNLDVHFLHIILLKGNFLPNICDYKIALSSPLNSPSLINTNNDMKERGRIVPGSYSLITSGFEHDAWPLKKPPPFQQSNRVIWTAESLQSFSKSFHVHHLLPSNRHVALSVCLRQVRPVYLNREHHKCADPRNRNL